MFPGQYANHNQVARGITGGTFSQDSTHYYRTFFSSGSLSLTKGRILASIFGIGGGSGNNIGRGGSSGQVIDTTREISRSKGTCTIVIGAGGSGPTAATSTTISDTATTNTASGAGFYVSGNGLSSGLDSFVDASEAYGGGGGALSNGQNGYAEFGYAVGGQGGSGTINPYFSATSTPSAVAGGGGGAAFEYYYGSGYGGGGVSGGGNGRGMASVATSGAVNTGAGGGGGALSSGASSVGGSGILIIRYSKNGAAG
jgi:hypothetical protein